MARALAPVLVLLVPYLRVLVEPQARPTRNMIFVVDTSGSMRGDKFTQALAGMTEVMEQPVDDMRVALVTFGSSVYRWGGRPRPGGARPVPAGWAELPDAEAVREAGEFAASMGAAGETYVIPALRHALGVEQDELTVVLVSDGIFQREDDRAVLEALEEEQSAREDRGLGRAVVVAYGVGDEQSSMRMIGEEGRGGYYLGVHGTPGDGSR